MEQVKEIATLQTAATGGTVLPHDKLPEYYNSLDSVVICCLKQASIVRVVGHVVPTNSINIWTPYVYSGFIVIDRSIIIKDVSTTILDQDTFITTVKSSIVR